MRELVLNADAWKSSDDLYDAFFAAVGAPSWHGRNFNALIDSIGTGGINEIEVPYRIVIQNAALMEPGAKAVTTEFISLVRELAARGCPVDIQPTALD